MEQKKSSLPTRLNSPGGETHGPGAAKAQPSKIIMVIMTVHVKDHRGALHIWLCDYFLSLNALLMRRRGVLVSSLTLHRVRPRLSS